MALQLYEKNNSLPLYANFCSNKSFGIGSKYGYQLFRVEYDEGVFAIGEEVRDEGHKYACIIELFVDDYFVAIVCQSSPRELQIFEVKEKVKSPIYNGHSYPGEILSVKVNALVLVVCLEDSIYIHDVSDLRVRKIIRDICNPRGLICLVNTKLAYPVNDLTGTICISEICEEENRPRLTNFYKDYFNIAAHQTPISCMALDEEARLVATASIKGTLIRVFNCLNGEFVQEFRRGSGTASPVCCLSFFTSKSGEKLIACSSDTSGVCVYKMTNAKLPHDLAEVVTNAVWWVTNAAYNTSAAILPTAVGSALSLDVSFAKVDLPFSGAKTMCSLEYFGDVIHLCIISIDGLFQIYTFDQFNGGLCELKFDLIVDPIRASDLKSLQNV